MEYTLHKMNFLFARQPHYDLPIQNHCSNLSRSMTKSES